MSCDVKLDGGSTELDVVNDVALDDKLDDNLDDKIFQLIRNKLKGDPDFDRLVGVNFDPSGVLIVYVKEKVADAPINEPVDDSPRAHFIDAPREFNLSRYRARRFETFGGKVD